ncbi:uncharacterized protein LOC114523707 [Dendronephthya gigantea]|uniref:uncharacterized protein LOC114523707 n=1 Tax=Dendronephthya gigantea TaxID=151771 RepID=UPI00106B0FFA|nr:uncharacterized protein LOC114523707 [Dendronephthya gigantea]
MMTSSSLSLAISYVLTAILASLLTTLFIDSTFREGILGGRTRLRRESLPVKVEKVILNKAVKLGACCLNGSPPAYHFRKGFGSGVKRWVVFFCGGAWCYDEEACYQRSHGPYGSSYNIEFSDGGMYSTDPQINPDFYNWNAVFVAYCDGSSFTGKRENPLYFMDKPVYFRGKVVLDAIIQDLLDRGIDTASDVLLTGSSAGSLAVLIHADYIKKRLNPHTKVRAIADSGYFTDIQTLAGVNRVRKQFKRMLITHNSTSGLHKKCVQQMAESEHWKCLFPEYFFHLIETPFFILQSAYDVWQIPNNLNILCNIPSYQDMLLYKSLGRLLDSPPDTPRRSSHSSRKKSHTTTVNSRAHKSNTIPGKKTYSLTKVPALTYDFLPRVNNRAKTLAFGRNDLTTSPNAPVWRSPKWKKNSFTPQVSYWKNPRPLYNSHQRDPGNSFLNARPFYTPVTSQDLRQQSLTDMQKVPFHNPQPALSTLDLSRVDRTRSYGPVNDGRFRLKRGAKGAQRASTSLRKSAKYLQKKELKKSRHNPPETRVKANYYQWHWQGLYSKPTACTRDEIKAILGLRKLTLKALKPVLKKASSGVFLSSCFEHTQASFTNIWKTNKIKGKSVRDAISEWYFEKPGKHVHIGEEFEFKSCTM